VLAAAFTVVVAVLAGLWTWSIFTLISLLS